MAYSDAYGQVYRIYIVTNSVNGKQYVGITNSLAKRWNKHRNAKGSAPALHEAIKKYGIDSFVFTHFADAFDPESAKSIEVMLIAEHNTLAPNGYNLTSGGDGTLCPSDEVRARMSEAHRGHKQSAETRAKRSESLKKAYAEGRKKSLVGTTWQMSEEGKSKTRAAKLGEKNPMYGKKQSAETKAKKAASMAIAMAKRKAIET
jgi:group I intron endonuclease